MRVKICGITSYQDAVDALEAGAGALGFNFVPSSKRYLEISEAEAITRRLPKRAWLVGIFADEEARNVEHLARRASLDTLQFHGTETPDYCGAFAEWRVIKALRISAMEDLAGAGEYLRFCEHILLDAYHPGELGGTGKRIDDRILAEARSLGLLERAFVAGGLTSSNVAEVIKLYQPFGVDIASGVESSPGVKDANKVRDFIEQTK